MKPGLESSIITNPIDEELEQVLQRRESIHRRSQIAETLESHNDFVFIPFSVEECIRQTVG